VFELVLLEMNDNRGREDYLKASASAEGALELALLSIKQKGYGYFHEIENSVNNEAIILSKDPTDTALFAPKDTLLSYTMDGKTSNYT